MAMSRLLDWFWTSSTPEKPDKVAGTSNVSQKAPASWRSNSVVQSPPVNVAVAIRQMVMKRLYDDDSSAASTFEVTKAIPKATSQTKKTVRNATARTESFTCQIRRR